MSVYIVNTIIGEIMRKVKEEDRTVSTSLTFKPKILKKVDAARGFMSRSAWIMTACDEKLKLDKRKAGIS